MSLLLRRYLQSRISKKFSEEEIQQFMLGDNALTIKQLEEDYGVNIITAFNDAKDTLRGGVRKASIYLLGNNLTKIKTPDYVFYYDSPARFALYSSNKLVKILNTKEEFVFEQSENNANYVVVYLIKEESVGRYMPNFPNVVAAFSAYNKGFNATGSLKQWFFYGDRNNFNPFPSCSFGTELVGEIYVPNGVNNFPSRCFQQQSKITKFRLPKSWKESKDTWVDDSLVFYDCRGVKKVVYEGTLQDWKNKYIDEKAVTKFSAFTPFLVSNVNAILCVNDNEDDIPTEVEYYDGEYTVGVGAFGGVTQITKLVLPRDIKRICAYAFHNCLNMRFSLDGMFSEIEYIGGNAFYKCKGITGELTLPPTLTYIGNSAFFECTGITGELVIPPTVTYIGADAFYKCTGLTGELVIPPTLTLENGAFRYGTFTSITISNGVTHLPRDLFYGCNKIYQEELIIPESVISFGDRFQFYTAKISRCILSQKAPTIPYGLFFQNAILVYLDFGEYITTLINRTREYGLPLRSNGAVVLRGDEIPEYYELIPNTDTATLFCKEEHVESFRNIWNTFIDYKGFSICDELSLVAEEGKYYYQNADNHIYKFENGNYVDITKTYGAL